MLGKPRILSLFLNSLINSIKHELSCKVLYLSPFYTLEQLYCHHLLCFISNSISCLLIDMLYTNVCILANPVDIRPNKCIYDDILFHFGRFGKKEILYTTIIAMLETCAQPLTRVC